MTTSAVAPPVSARRNVTKRRAAGAEHTRPAWLFLAPFVVLYLLFIIGPTIYGFILSFFNTSLVHSGVGSSAGLANYRELLNSSLFWDSVGHTIYFTIITTIPLVILAFVFAILANRVRRGQWFFRLAFFIPFVLPSATISLIWTFIYTPATGLLTAALEKLGYASPPAWLGDPTWAMPSVAIATVWWTVGFNFVLYLAGLQDIPRELYEAASIDGASQWQQIRRITIPLLNRTSTLVIVLQIIASLKIFDQIFLLTSGGPGEKTRPVLEYVYDIGFTDYRVGAAAAASVLFFILVLIVSAVWLALTSRQQREA